MRCLVMSQWTTQPACSATMHKGRPPTGRSILSAPMLSTHPWEDWAECWAHYLHMRDAIDTALSFGLSVDRFDLEFMPFTQEALFPPGHPDAEEFLALLNHWTRLTTLLNEMSRSMGQPDFYPFVLQPDVVRKLHFIHRVVTSAGWPQDAGRKSVV